MIRLITKDDIIDVLLKGKQRGWNFILSKLTFSNVSRTKTAFNESAKISSNWHNIPYVKKRWNKLIFGDENLNYEEYLMQTILNKKSNLKLLSLGSGFCNHEIKLAEYSNFEQITCVDLSEYRISEAKNIAKKKNLKNIEFICSNLEDFHFSKSHFDIVLFNSSLHHFKNVESLLVTKILYCLNDSGLLVINEYVGPNRLQFSKWQVKKINEAIKIIPRKFRKRFKTSLYKKNFSGYGIIRMIIADPSECVDSASIIPSIHKYFEAVIEEPYGGNILMHALKDISHNFIDLNKENKRVLDCLFQFEDEYLKKNPSDFVFGVYKKTIANTI